jgi:DNA helicase-2/ATP-dependent DNA helicase PcrA
MTAFEQIVKHVEDKKSFVLEAGAGSGKTYTLIQTLNYLIESKGIDIQYNHQRIICITYTNVAKNEIIERLENNPLVLVSTIHEFLWDCIKSFQKQLKIELCKLNEIRLHEDLIKAKIDTKYIANLSDRIKDIYNVNYEDTAFRDFEKGILHHDDVIVLSKLMFESNSLLTTIITQKYPFILVDEYQDTAEETITSLIDYLLERNANKIVLGFYGDSHQKIYESGVGDLEKYYVDEQNKKIELVKKEENYRSSKEVVRLLNNFRTNIQQTTNEQTINGSVKFVYCRNYPEREFKGTNSRTKDEGKIEYEKRIEPLKNINYDKLKLKLETLNWSFIQDSDDKILVIANSRVANRAGFGNLYSIYSRKYGQSTKEHLLDRNHPLIKHFVGYIDKKTSIEREVGVEHLINFWKTKNYNEVLRFLKKYSGLINDKYLKHSHKILITRILNKLEILRESKTVFEVFDFLDKNKILNKSDSFNKLLDRINKDITSMPEGRDKERVQEDKNLFDSIMSLPYSEIINFFEHTQNHTVFSTKHGTKGEEYRNVLTIIDDTEWKQEYNFENFFNNTDDNERRKLKTRNLFYVECSRAKENLVVFALSEMNDVALNNVRIWFGDENVLSIEEFIEES